MAQPSEPALADGLLCGAAALARSALQGPAAWALGWRSLEAALGERPTQAAPTLVFDLSVLLTGERVGAASRVAPPAVLDALRAFEDHVLARLRGERRFQRLAESVAAAPPALRPQAVGLVAAHLGQRLTGDAGVGVSQALVRRLSQLPVAEVLEAGEAALFRDDVARPLAEGLLATVQAARRHRELLTDADVFLAQNIGALAGLGPRTALTQLSDAAQAVEERLPRRLRLPADAKGLAPTSLEAESAFPMGGFSSVTTRGTPENLVTSELAYMDPSDGRPDLFDVRYVEGELLYFDRDESVALQRRRVLTVVLDDSLVRARLLDPGERVQRLIWALGALAALTRRLLGALGGEALAVHFVFVEARGETALAEEQAVLRLVLRDALERGHVTCDTAPDAAEAVRQAVAAHAGAAHVVVLGTAMPRGLEGEARPDAYVDLGAATPAVHRRTGASPSVGGQGAADTSALLALALIQGLFAAPRRGSP